MSDYNKNRGRGRGREYERDTNEAASSFVNPQRSVSHSPSDRASREPRVCKVWRGDGKDSNHGAARGRPTRIDVVHTRPDFVKHSKKGCSGRVVPVKTNYFRLMTVPNWTINQYHVDFVPEVDLTRTRKYLFRQHQALFTGFIFDGAILYTSTKLPNEITELTSICKRRDEEDQVFKVKVKYIKEVAMTEEHSLMVFNNILRRAMEGLKLQLVGRNFYDAQAKIPIREYNLELWPGYVTSIRQHENNLLMCAEISTKVMRQETLHNILGGCMSRDKDFKESFKKIVIGCTVLTDYSNKTYRVDDVDWDQNPNSTFDTRAGKVAYKE